MKRRILLVILGSMWAFSGCGGGGNSSGTGSSSGSGATVNISGAVVEGPVKQASIKVLKRTGTYITGATATTNDDGSYSVSVPANEELPWKIEVSGGIDTVTNEALTIPLTTLVTSSTQTTANASTLSTLVTNAVESSAGSLANVTASDVSTMAQQVVKNFGFGVDGENSSIDIISTPITSSNVSSFAMASEALGELVRRTANAVTGTGGVAMTPARMMQALAEDMSDGKMDGNKKVGSTVSGVTTSDIPDLNKVLATVETQKAQVVLEVMTNNLTVTKNDGTSVTADEVKSNMKSVLAPLVTRLEGVTSTADQIATKMAAVPISDNMIQQGKAAVATVLALNPNSTTFTQLQNNFNSWSAGTKFSTIAKDLGISGGSTSTGSFLDLAKAEMNTMAASVTGGSIATTNFTALLNHAPYARDNVLYLTMTPGQSVSAVLPGVDMDGDTLTYILVNQPVKGTVTITNAATGAFTYTATDKNGSEWRGADKFSFIISDGKLTSTGAWVNIMIKDPNLSNQPPGVPTSSLQLTVTSGMTMTGMMTGFDPEGKQLTFSVSQQPTQGTLTINNGAALFNTSNGSTLVPFSYFSNGNNGVTDTFGYVAFDGTVTSTSAAVVNITVQKYNRKPIRPFGLPSMFTITGNTTTLSNYLANKPLYFVDLDGDTITAYDLTVTAGSTSTSGVISYGNGDKYLATGKGYFYLRKSDGTFDYTPAGGATQIDSFHIRAYDGSLWSDPYRFDVNIYAPDGGTPPNGGGTPTFFGWTNTGSGWTYTGGTFTGNAWTLSGGAWTYVSGVLDLGHAWVNLGGTWQYINDPLSNKAWSFVNGAWISTVGWIQTPGGWTYINGAYTGPNWTNTGGSWTYVSGVVDAGKAWVFQNGTWQYVNDPSSNKAWSFINGAWTSTVGWIQTPGGWTYANGAYTGPNWTNSGGSWTYVSGVVDAGKAWVYLNGTWQYIDDPSSNKAWSFINGAWTGTSGWTGIRRASVSSSGMLGNALSGGISPTSGNANVSSITNTGGITGISANGRYVTFTSQADNLVAGDTNKTPDIFLHDLETSTTTRVSVSGTGLEASVFTPAGGVTLTGGVSNTGGASQTGGHISADGRYVVFQSNANNLVPGDTNGTIDIFRKDLLLGDVIRINVNSAGEQGMILTPTGGGAFSMVSGATLTGGAEISADGRYVVFQSDANNLVTGDTNQGMDIFLRDTLLNTTSRISVSSSGDQAMILTPTGGGSLSVVSGASVTGGARISANGRFVAFYSDATNLVPNDTNGGIDVFLRDLQQNTTTRVSVDSAGNQAMISATAGVTNTGGVAISADGRFVVFESPASNLVPNDTNNGMDVFVRDTLLGTTSRVSVSSTGVQSNISGGQMSVSGGVDISADGRYVVFSSMADNLVLGDTNQGSDIFLHDRQTGTTRILVNSIGEQGYGNQRQLSYNPRISANGQYVLFTSNAINLLPGDFNDTSDIYVASLSSFANAVTKPSWILPERSWNYNPGGWTYTGGTYTGNDWTLSGGGWTLSGGATQTSGWTLTSASEVWAGGAWTFTGGSTYNGNQFAFLNGEWTNTGGVAGWTNTGGVWTYTGGTSTVSIGNGSGTEGGSIAFPITLSSANGMPVTVNIVPNSMNTASGNAQMWSDYQGNPSRVTFMPGETAKSVEISTYQDVYYEGNETFTVGMSLATPWATLGTSQATGTIIDDDAYPTVQFTSTGQTKFEGDLVRIPLQMLSFPGAGSISIPFTVTGSATQGSDYQLITSSPLSITSYYSGPSISFRTKLDQLTETGGENIVITLGTPTNANLGTISSHTVTLNEASLPQSVVADSGQQGVYAARDDGALSPTVGVAWPSPRFTVSNGTVTDHLTGLVWLQNANCFGSGSWTTALNNANGLANGACGLTDSSTAGQWRLPNRFELESLLDFGRTAPPLPEGHPFTNLQFTSTGGNSTTGGGGYWTSTPYYNNNYIWNGSIYEPASWTVEFNLGTAKGQGRSIANSMMMVRDGSANGPAPALKTGISFSNQAGDDGALKKGLSWTPTGSTRFVDNADGTIIDRLTGLIWLKNAYCYSTQTWSSAINSINNLANGNCGLTDNSASGDWRLPNIREMNSLLDMSTNYPAIQYDYNTFTYQDGYSNGRPWSNLSSVTYWTSTTVATNVNQAWTIDFSLGTDINADKSSFKPFMAVRGGMFSTTGGSTPSGGSTPTGGWTMTGGVWTFTGGTATIGGNRWMPFNSSWTYTTGVTTTGGFLWTYTGAPLALGNWTLSGGSWTYTGGVADNNGNWNPVQTGWVYDVGSTTSKTWNYSGGGWITSITLGSTTPTGSYYTLSGKASNLPFKTGASVSCSKINTDGTIGTSVSTSVTDVLGSYSCGSINWVGPTRITVQGDMPDVVVGSATATQTGAVMAIINMDNSNRVANVNTLTTMAAKKIEQGLVQSMSIGTSAVDALIQSSSQEVVNTLFGTAIALPNSLKLEDLNPFDTPTGNAVRDLLNAALATFDYGMDKSAINQGSLPVQYLTMMGVDMRHTGQQNSGVQSLVQSVSKSDMPSKLVGISPSLTTTGYVNNLIASGGTLTPTTFASVATSSGLTFNPVIIASGPLTHSGGSITLSVGYMGANNSGFALAATDGRGGTVTFGNAPGVNVLQANNQVTVFNSTSPTSGITLNYVPASAYSGTAGYVLVTATSLTDSSKRGTLVVPYTALASNQTPKAKAGAFQTAGYLMLNLANSNVSSDQDAEPLTYYVSNMVSQTGNFTPTMGWGVGFASTLSSWNTSGGLTFSGDYMALTQVGMANGGLSFTGKSKLNDSILGTLTINNGLVTYMRPGYGINSPGVGFTGTFGFGYAVIDAKGYGRVEKVYVGVSNNYNTTSAP